VCELFGVVSSKPVQLRYSLHAFAEHGGLIHPNKSGWGIAYHEGKDALLVKEPDPDSAAYYEELTLDVIGGQLYGEEFVQWMIGEVAPGEVLYRIADEAGVVLMPGRGFGDTAPSARVSLANLNESDYAAIGTAIRRLLDDYYERFKNKN
jgi:hypothetical protein